MAHRSRASSPAPTIHRKKLFGGRETAQEVHRKIAWHGGTCYRCGSTAVVVQLSYSQSPLDLSLHEPNLTAQLIAASEDGQLPVWRSTYGPMVIYWVEYACAHHQKETEIDAARLPSYVLVQIDRGVGEDKVVSAVPREYRPHAAEPKS